MLTTSTYQLQSLSAITPPLNEPIQMLLADAMQHLGALNAYSQLVPNIDYFIRMHIAKEATTSSKIEGTKTNLQDVLIDDEESRGELSAEQRDDLEEVQNYIKAINSAIKALENLPLTTRLMCNTHRILLSGVRGYTRAPGQIRRVQNWIGGGGGITSAVFVPPSSESVPDLLTDLDLYWQTNKSAPALVKIALAHHQFETIHPFLDGNGRLGRLMIALQLIDAGILRKPALYISDYFEHHRTAYYDALEHVRTSGDYDQWVRFFLGAVVEVSRDAVLTLQAIVTLDREYAERIQQSNLSRTRQGNARILLVMLYAQPIVSIRQVAAMTGHTFQTANDLVGKLEDLGLLREMTGDAKNRKYVLYEYFNLFDKPRREHESE